MLSPERSAADIFCVTAPESLIEAFDAAQFIVTVTEGPEHRLVWRNRQAIETFGPMVLGRPLAELVPESAAVLPLWDRAFAGESVAVPRQEVAVRDSAGGRRVMRYTMSPLRDGDGRPVGVIQFVSDATAEAVAEAAAAGHRLLADVTVRLAAAPTAPAALRSLAGALVPEFADLAALYVYPAAGERAAGDGSLAPTFLATSPALAQSGPPPSPRDRDHPTRWRSALAAGHALVAPVDAGFLDELADPPVAEWLRRVGATSLAITPLSMEREVVGALLVMSAGDRAVFTEDHLELLGELMSRAGAAISEVRARSRARRIAQRLQAALLPVELPQPPGLELAARYVAGGRDEPVGGDWWDVVDLGGGHVGMGVGDISGHGLAAAALMGQARVAMRAASHAHLAPAALLEVLDRQLTEAVDREWGGGLGGIHRFATALYAHLDPDRKELRIASAGHLPVLVRSPRHRARVIWTPSGPPLGLALGGYEEVVVPFGPGDTVVLYTDGLVEDRALSVGEGIDRLAVILDRAGCDLTIEELTEVLLREMRAQTEPEDDIAVVVARALPA